MLAPPIVAFKDRAKRGADGRPQTYYVPAKTDLRNGEALPPQNNAYEFFDVKNTDADVQRWLVLDVTGGFLPRQAIAQFLHREARGHARASQRESGPPPHDNTSRAFVGLQRLQNAGMPDDELTRINDVPGYFFY